MKFEKSSGCVFKDLGVEKPEVVMKREEIQRELFHANREGIYLPSSYMTNAINFLLTENKRIEEELTEITIEGFDGNTTIHGENSSREILFQYGLEEL
jgi:hypothetical protein